MGRGVNIETSDVVTIFCHLVDENIVSELTYSCSISQFEDLKPGKEVDVRGTLRK